MDNSHEPEHKASSKKRTKSTSSNKSKKAKTPVKAQEEEWILKAKRALRFMKEINGHDMWILENLQKHQSTLGDNYDDYVENVDESNRLDLQKIRTVIVPDNTCEQFLERMDSLFLQRLENFVRGSNSYDAVLRCSEWWKENGFKPLQKFCVNSAADSSSSTDTMTPRSSKRITILKKTRKSMLKKAKKAKKESKKSKKDKRSKKVDSKKSSKHKKSSKKKKRPHREYKEDEDEEDEAEQEEDKETKEIKAEESSVFEDSDNVPIGKSVTSKKRRKSSELDASPAKKAKSEDKVKSEKKPDKTKHEKDKAPKADDKTSKTDDKKKGEKKQDEKKKGKDGDEKKKEEKKTSNKKTSAKTTDDKTTDKKKEDKKSGEKTTGDKVASKATDKSEESKDTSKDAKMRGSRRSSTGSNTLSDGKGDKERREERAAEYTKKQDVRVRSSGIKENLGPSTKPNPEFEGTPVEWLKNAFKTNNYKFCPPGGANQGIRVHLKASDYIHVLDSVMKVKEERRVLLHAGCGTGFVACLAIASGAPFVTGCDSGDGLSELFCGNTEALEAQFPVDPSTKNKWNLPTVQFGQAAHEFDWRGTLKGFENHWKGLFANWESWKPEEKELCINAILELKKVDMIVVSSRVDNQCIPDIKCLCEAKKRKIEKYERISVSCSGGGTKLNLHVYYLDHPEDDDSPYHPSSYPKTSSCASSVIGAEKDDVEMKDSNLEEDLKPKKEETIEMEVGETDEAKAAEETKVEERASSDLLISDGSQADNDVADTSELVGKDLKDDSDDALPKTSNDDDEDDETGSDEESSTTSDPNEDPDDHASTAKESGGNR
eukprot:Platyproteum_vivax@DN6934_c0_g1_i1.p1